MQHLFSDLFNLNSCQRPIRSPQFRSVVTTNENEGRSETSSFLRVQPSRDLDIDCWTRSILFSPLDTWVILAATSRIVAAAAVCAASGEQYACSEMKLELGLDEVTNRNIILALAHLHIAALHLHMWEETHQLPAFALRPFLRTMKLSGHAWVLLMERSRGCLDECKVGSILCHRLINLDIRELYSCRGRVLSVFLTAGALRELRELFAGCPAHEGDTVGEHCFEDDRVIDQLVALSEASPKLETLDVRWSRSECGLDYSVCDILFSRLSNLRHVDFTMVMTWRDFDPVLHLLATKATCLETLAAGGGYVPNGLVMSTEALNHFCAEGGGSLRNLQLQSCTIRPFGIPAFHRCPRIRSLNLGGTLLFFRDGDPAKSPLGHWLFEVGCNMKELVMMGAIFVGDETDETVISNRVIVSEEWLRAQCPFADPFSVVLTAVSDIPRFHQGFPKSLNDMHTTSSAFAIPPFLDRVRAQESMPVICATSCIYCA